MNRLCGVLFAIASVPLLVVLALLYALFVLYIFPSSGYGHTVGPLDLMFSYSTDTAYEMIGAYGDEGRARYARGAMTVDVAYPVIYTLLFMVWLTLVLRSASLTSTKRCLLITFPLTVLILDLIENAGIVILLKTYPQRHEALVAVTSLATSAKWSVAGLVVLATLIATAHWAWRCLRDR